MGAASQHGGGTSELFQSTVITSQHRYHNQSQTSQTSQTYVTLSIYEQAPDARTHAFNTQLTVVGCI